MFDDFVEFDEFTFVPSTGELKRRGAAVALEHQPARMLAQLVRAQGRLVSREEMAAAIWKDGTHVKVDDGLNYCVRQVRAAMGDDAKAPRFVETVPRRGYRFVAAVRTPRSRRWSVSRWLAAAAAAAALVAAIVAVESRPNDHHRIAVSVARALHNAIF